MLVKLKIFPNFRVKIKNIWNHPLFMFLTHAFLCFQKSGLNKTGKTKSGILYIYVFGDDFIIHIPHCAQYLFNVPFKSWDTWWLNLIQYYFGKARSSALLGLCFKELFALSVCRGQTAKKVSERKNVESHVSQSDVACYGRYFWASSLHSKRWNQLMPITKWAPTSYITGLFHPS